jgi:hypothetical protein
VHVTWHPLLLVQCTLHGPWHSISQFETRSQRTWLFAPTCAAQWLTSEQLKSQAPPQARSQSLLRLHVSWQRSPHAPSQTDVSLQSYLQSSSHWAPQRVVLAQSIAQPGTSLQNTSHSG